MGGHRELRGRTDERWGEGVRELRGEADAAGRARAAWREEVSAIDSKLAEAVRSVEAHHGHWGQLQSLATDFDGFKREVRAQLDAGSHAHARLRELVDERRLGGWSGASDAGGGAGGGGAGWLTGGGEERRVAPLPPATRAPPPSFSRSTGGGGGGGGPPPPPATPVAASSHRAPSPTTQTARPISAATAVASPRLAPRPAEF